MSRAAGCQRELRRYNVAMNKHLRDMLLELWLLIPMVAFAVADLARQESWSWQGSYAQVDPTGGLAWQPRPFGCESAAPVRHIDFWEGNDANFGDAPGKTWKQHAKDPK